MEEEKVAPIRLTEKLIRETLNEEGKSKVDELSELRTVADQNLSQIKKADITELKKLPNPPVMVKDVMEIVCLLMKVAPEKVRGGDDDYWKAAVKLLNDPALMRRLLEYDAWSLQGKAL